VRAYAIPKYGGARQHHGARLVAAILALAFGCAHADAYSVNDAVAYALAHNPSLGAAREQASAADARARAAQSADRPRIDARYGVRRSDNPLDAFADKLNTRRVDPATDFGADALNHPGASTLHNAGIALEWPVYTGGRVAAGIEEARHNERAASLGYARRREVVAFETVAAYRRAQAATAAVSIADDAVRAAERHATTTARLAKQNRIVASDKLTAEVNLALIRSQRERTMTARLNALTQLKRAMGLPYDRAIEIERWDEAAFVAPPSDSLDAIESRALTQRRDIAAEKALFEAARSRVVSARARRKPEISVIASENWYDDSFGLSNNSYTVGATARFNLYDGGRDREETRAAQHGANEREQRLLALNQQVRQEVRDAYYALNDARARLDICADNAGKARRTVELVRARYGEGRTILIDLLQAERVLVETRTTKLSAMLDLAISDASLRLAEGAFALPGE
jgi:outer membrane protein